MIFKIICAVPDYIGRDLVEAIDEKCKHYYIDPITSFGGKERPAIEDFVGKTIEIDYLQGYIWIGCGVRILQEGSES